MAFRASPWPVPPFQYQWALWRIDDEGSNVIIAAVGSQGSTYSDFIGALPENDCRYGGAVGWEDGMWGIIGRHRVLPAHTTPIENPCSVRLPRSHARGPGPQQARVPQLVRGGVLVGRSSLRGTTLCSKKSFGRVPISPCPTLVRTGPLMWPGSSPR